MNVVLKIPIKCGKKTCASEPGVFCRFLGSKGINSWVCMLFPMLDEMKASFKEEVGSSTQLKENADGWIARCPECLTCGV